MWEGDVKVAVNEGAEAPAAFCSLASASVVSSATHTAGSGAANGFTDDVVAGVDATVSTSTAAAAEGGLCSQSHNWSLFGARLWGNTPFFEEPRAPVPSSGRRPLRFTYTDASIMLARPNSSMTSRHSRPLRERPSFGCALRFRFGETTTHCGDGIVFFYLGGWKWARGMNFINEVSLIHGQGVTRAFSFPNGRRSFTALCVLH